MRKDIKDILERIASGNYDQQDEEIAKRWIFNLRNTDLEQLTEAELEETSRQMWKELVPNQIVTVRRFPLWSRIASIAAVILFVSIVGYYIYQYQQPITAPEIQTTAVETILPGGNRAYITTESGEVITLSTDQSGLVIGDNIKYLDGSQVEGLQQTSQAIQQLTMTVPVAGTYQLQLADGTKVWLNSASKLSYPSSFSGEQRVVELEGEAYFEIAKDTNRPFKVYSKGQEIEVLGTHFNVNTYAGEVGTTTTLLEGSVKLIATTNGKNIILRPGQQATMQNNQTFNVKQGNVENVVAWKKGLFIFDDQKLEQVMEQIARWYDVEVVYEKGVPAVVLAGVMSRQEPLERLLSLLEKVGKVKFTLVGKKIIVNQSKTR